ncbi:MAG: hypothetical protein AB1461_01695 [Thermodesulfobacteriota bacterium]
MKHDPMKIFLAFGLCCFYAACVMACTSSPRQAHVAGETLSPPVAMPETASDPAAAKTAESVADAFGIPLGKRFAPSMVARVIGQEAHSYQGQDKTTHQGMLYRVEPAMPDSSFSHYTVKTNKDGVIYTIEADYQDADKQNLCKQTEQLARLLEGKYGKPRGKGMLGDWYVFRESGSGPYKGVRLYAPKCRLGRYSISYSDDNAKEMKPVTLREPMEPEPLPDSTRPSTGTPCP